MHSIIRKLLCTYLQMGDLYIRLTFCARSKKCLAIHNFVFLVIEPFFCITRYVFCHLFGIGFQAFHFYSNFWFPSFLYSIYLSICRILSVQILLRLPRKSLILISWYHQLHIIMMVFKGKKTRWIVLPLFKEQ